MPDKHACCALSLMHLACPAAKMPTLSHAVQGTATPQNSACSIDIPSAFTASGVDPLLAPPASWMGSLAAQNKILLLLLLLSSSKAKRRLSTEPAMEASKYLGDCRTVKGLDALIPAGLGAQTILRS